MRGIGAVIGGRHSGKPGLLTDAGGAVALWVAILFPIFIGFGALAFDISHFLVVRGEVQNAADAGALAGARFLYSEDGTSVNPGANQIAYDAATVNRSQNQSVYVGWTSGNEGDVQRGHWSFATRAFTPNDSLSPVDLWNRSSAELDADPNFINAVRVRARRRNPHAISVFGRIFGVSGYEIPAEAVGYIAFSASLGKGEVDQPIAICKQSLVNEAGEYTCSRGRMINSGSNAGHQTGGWTNFSQEPCETASTPTVRPLVCASGNPNPISFGEGMGTTGGMIESAYDQMRGCWMNYPGLDTDADGWPDQPWELTLAVIDCPENNTGNCSTLVGAVTVQVLWITRTDKNQMAEVPMKMADWTCPSESTPQQCWSDFVTHFQLHDVSDDTPATYEDKTIYFKPDCSYHDPTGSSGGGNYGILAKIPVLVR